MDAQNDIITARIALREAEDTARRLFTQANMAKALWEATTAAASKLALDSSAPLPPVLVATLSDLNELNNKLRQEVWFLFKEEQKAADEEDRLARQVDRLAEESDSLRRMARAFEDAAEEMGVR